MRFIFILTITILSSDINTMACFARGANTIRARNSSDLQEQLDRASPGDTIVLLPIDYYGDFILPDKGLSSVITLKGKNLNAKSTRILGTKTALTISGGLWCISNLGIESAKQGVIIKGSNHLLKSLSITGVDQGVIIQGDSNKLESISITKGDKGVIVRGNKNELLYTSCTGQTEFGVSVESGNETNINSLSVNEAKKYSLILGESTSGGNMESLSVDGLLEIKGRGNNFKSLSSSGIVNVLGCGNTFSSASVEKMFVTKECQNSLDSYNSIQTFLTKPYTV